MLKIKKYTAFKLTKSFDAKGKPTFKRGAKLHTSKLTVEQAKELNSQKGNTLIEYANPENIVEPKKADAGKDEGK